MVDAREKGILDLRGWLAAVEDAPPVEAVDVVSEEVRRRVDGSHASLLLTNLTGSALVRLSHVSAAGKTHDGRNERAEAVALPGSIYERAMFDQSTAVVPDGEGWLLLAPVTERGDALGLLEVSFDEEPGPGVVEVVSAAAHALAYILIASRRHTDVFERAQRDSPFSLPAEVQRRLLPSAYTVEGGHFSLAGWLEPANEVGGDTFDYSVDREYLYASMTDAMGHGVDAALLATLVVGSLRNARRGAASPAEQADAANAALLAHAQPDQFVTGQFLRIRLADGAVDFVNAGHPGPYLCRDGRTTEVEIDDPQPPLGITRDGYRTQTATLVRGDRLVLVTDGYLERNAVRLDLSHLLDTSRNRHPREVVRELAGQVLVATEGRLLDDATILCIDWYGSDDDRQAVNGADPARATHSDGPPGTATP